MTADPPREATAPSAAPPSAADVAARLAADWPPTAWRELRLLVAVSGGADSVALLLALCELAPESRGRWLVGHCHHGLRESADRDQKFVAALARREGVSFRALRVEVPKIGGEGQEAAARQVRYGALQTMAREHGARHVVLAHTADDQIETVLQRILRGAGLAGLAGIPRTRLLEPGLALIRPLLQVRRSEILDWLAARGQSFCCDESNEDRRFTRNRLRHDLLPLLAAEYNPQVGAALLRLSQSAAEAQQALTAAADELLQQCLERAQAAFLNREASTSTTPDEDDRLAVESIPTESIPHESIREDFVRLDCRPLRGRPRHAIREMFVTLWRRAGWPLQAMAFVQWEALAEMALGSMPITASGDGAPLAQTFPGGIQAVARDGAMTLARRR